MIPYIPVLDSGFFPGHVSRSSPHWTMPPPSQQPRPYLQQSSQQVTTTQGSALIAQLTQPPSSISGNTVNQFVQSKWSDFQIEVFIPFFLVNANSPINKINIGPQSNVQTSLPQNQGTIQSIAQVSQTSQAVTSSSQVNKYTKQLWCYSIEL